MTLAKYMDKARELNPAHMEHLGASMIRGVRKVRFRSCNCEREHVRILQASELCSVGCFRATCGVEACAKGAYTLEH